MEWKVRYDVSEGMDTDGFLSTQAWNPFNGDVVAPDAWRHMGITRGIRCAFGKDSEGVLHACIFVFEYSIEYGTLLHEMADQMSSGSFVQRITLNDLPAYGVTMCGVSCELKRSLTAIRFSRPDALSSRSPVCCEMHVIISRASSHPDEECFQPFLHDKECTSGHMQVRSLVGKEKWRSFTDSWMAGKFTAILYSGAGTKQKERGSKKTLSRLHSLCPQLPELL